ncbi:hypothetical protein [Nocardia sp. R6R-6]|uniref:hypothetical protein n=1 Tax=Nocardia sp. R6R-6 TaxID=3459303 RepID=UPI00403D9160
MGGEPEPHLDEAAEQTVRLADAPAGTSILCNPTFGPANVQLWRMSAAMERRWSGRVHCSDESAGYCGGVGLSEYGPGDVVYFPEGPFSGICAVVQEVDLRRRELRVVFSEGTVHREGNILRERRHSLTVGLDEIELI